MIKKIGFFAIAALLIAGCSSNEEKEAKNRGFKESVYAFVNSQPNIVGYGRMDVETVMKESEMEQMGMFQMVAAQTYEDLKDQVDTKEPVYLATTTTENHSDLTLYAMIKLKDRKKFIDYWTSMNYVFKKHKGISYAEDNEKILAVNDKMLMVIMAPGQFDGKALATKAFDYTTGKMATGSKKKHLEAEGDFVMHIDLDPIRENDRSMSMLPKGTEIDMALNFNNGKMTFDVDFNDFKNLQSQLGMKMSDEPMIAKKLEDAEGNVLMAMQLSMQSPLMDFAGINADEMERSLTGATMLLSNDEVSMEMSNITPEDNIVMPESGKAMGDQPMEIMVDLDAMAVIMPQYKDYLSKLDYASFVVSMDHIRLVIASNEANQNFLATVLKTADTFLMSGGLMQMMANQ